MTIDKPIKNVIPKLVNRSITSVRGLLDING